jgi:hypothetical protein
MSSRRHLYRNFDDVPTPGNDNAPAAGRPAITEVARGHRCSDVNNPV